MAGGEVQRWLPARLLKSIKLQMRAAARRKDTLQRVLSAVERLSLLVFAFYSRLLFSIFKRNKRGEFCSWVPGNNVGKHQLFPLLFFFCFRPIALRVPTLYAGKADYEVARSRRGEMIVASKGKRKRKKKKHLLLFFSLWHPRVAYALHFMFLCLTVVFLCFFRDCNTRGYTTVMES